MIKKKLAKSALLFASAFLFGSAGTPGAAQVNRVTGQWTFHHKIAGNEFDSDCKLIVTDNQIAGTCKGQDKDHPITGKIDGKTATWQVEPDSHGTQLTFIYTATLGDSEKFAGTFEVKPYGVKGEFTAAVSSPASQTGPVDAAVGQRLVLEAGPGGLFKNQADIGKGDPAGKASFDAKSGAYTIESSGMNLWAKVDAFHMIWKKVTGDVSLTADVEVSAPSSATSNTHRKAVLIFRQTLDVDSAAAYVGVHGTGYTALQYRPSKGALTQEVAFDPDAPTSIPTQSRTDSLIDPLAHLPAPKIVRLEKRGDTITLFVSMKGEPLHRTGASIKLHFAEPFYVGLGVASHQNGQLEKAVFKHVELKRANSK
jgi:hypothetical protein